jgi:hypothetical protein
MMAVFLLPGSGEKINRTKVLPLTALSKLTLRLTGRSLVCAPIRRCPLLWLVMLAVMRLRFGGDG